ncbi:unnamed protein product [Blepharisma stoltei]|uniref:Kinesin-like protein n=1 Tax=Blepharisma stoltei TaxID=1481888 RepID=A0AAU9ITK8_9CILI|nr:unnamed protein product [Blepharisma stoltei]
METSRDTNPNNVRVFCRFRPLSTNEAQIFQTKFIDISSDCKSIIIQPSKQGADTQIFNYDHAFASESSQELVYELSAKPIVDSVMHGFNGTIFAYGQTASGKTYTMMGPSLDSSDHVGIIPRTISTVFSEIDNSESSVEFSVKVSYCELYMEDVKDLLNENKGKLKIREDKARGVYLEGLTEVYVSSGEEVYELLEYGNSNRVVGFTRMNERSSRSHSIFTLTVSQTNTVDLSQKSGKLHLIDLAGSEKVSKTGAEGTRLEEAKKINKSLTALGLVINSLSKGAKGHIPYRDSKLTWILQDSLGGNSLTSVIITCSPSLYNEDETISSLRFGIRAKLISNTPKINKEFTVGELKLLLAEAKEEIKKKDMKIKKLEETLMRAGLSISQSTTIDDSGLFESDTRTEYADLIQELEETREILSNEVEENSKIKDTLTQLQLEFVKVRNDYEKLKTQYKEASDFEKESKEKDEIIEKLKITLESIQSEFTNINGTKEFLENRLVEKEAEIDFLKQRYEYAPRSQSKIEKEQKEIAVITKYHESLNQVDLIYTINENLNENSLLEERKKLAKDLHAKIRQLIELEIEFEDFKERYTALENSLPFDVQEERKKNCILERRLVQLSMMYRQLTNQKSSLVVDKGIHEKKIQRLTEKLKISENNYLKIKEQLRQADEQIQELMKEVETPNTMPRLSVTGHSGLNINSKIKKTMRGGKADKYTAILDQLRTLSNNF